MQLTKERLKLWWVWWFPWSSWAQRDHIGHRRHWSRGGPTELQGDHEFHKSGISSWTNLKFNTDYHSIMPTWSIRCCVYSMYSTSPVTTTTNTSLIHLHTTFASSKAAGSMSPICRLESAALKVGPFNICFSCLFRAKSTWVTKRSGWFGWHSVLCFSACATVAL